MLLHLPLVVLAAVLTDRSQMPAGHATLEFDEVPIATGTVVTDQLAPYGVTFSPGGWVYAPQMGFFGIDASNLGNFGAPGVSCAGARSMTFASPRTAAGFNVVTNPEDSLRLTALRGGAVVEAATFDTSLDRLYFVGLAVAGGFDTLVVEGLGASGCFLVDRLAHAGTAAARCRDVVVDAGASCAAEASIDAGSSGACAQSPAGPYGLGTTAVTLACGDGAGSTSSCAGTVTVEDRTPPSLAAPGCALASCDGTVSVDERFALDNCPGATVECTPGFGEVTCAAVDASGNTSAPAAVTAVEPLSVSFEPPLSNGALFTAGQALPHKVTATDCAGRDVTRTVQATLRFTRHSTELARAPMTLAGGKLQAVLKPNATPGSIYESTVTVTSGVCPAGSATVVLESR